jgi:hypothetical protein
MLKVRATGGEEGEEENITEDRTLNNHCCEDLEVHICNICLKLKKKL